MNELAVSFAFWDYDRTLPLVDGRVSVEGCAPAFKILAPEDAFARAFTTAEFDVTEISLSNYITALSEGATPYAVLPVFLSRAFRLGTIYLRTDCRIAHPGDLAGKRIGLHEYGMTAAVVVRGILRDHFALDTRQLTWFVGGVERANPGSRGGSQPVVGADVRRVDDGRTLDAMLVAGELDALISLRVPPSFAADHPKIRRLFSDWRAAEQDYYRKSGVFPIMHAVGVRRTLLADNPWLVTSIYKAFVGAKEIAISDLGGGHVTALPWEGEELADTHALMGHDFWPYGIAANRAALDALLRWSREDGLQARPVSVDELFATAMLRT
jgi:4,5-dihydroxyphthalate decarboxylase